MYTRSIPSKQAELISFAARALAGANDVGEDIELAQNTPAKIESDLYAVIGAPGAGPAAGTQNKYNVARAALTAAQGTRRQVRATARVLAAKGVDHLKSFLGRRWSPAWQAVGFAQGLRLPLNLLPLLTQMRGYLRDNPTHENVATGVTAAAVDAQITAWQAAFHAVDTAQAIRTAASEVHQLAIATLTRRLTGLRTELDQLLTDDDERWYEFGFSRPIDLLMPAAIEGLALRLVVPGEVQATWEPAARAENYRVSWTLAEGNAEPVDLGLFSDPVANLSSLPPAVTIRVDVTARNSAGETPAVSAVIALP